MPDVTGVAADPVLPNFSFLELLAKVVASMLISDYKLREQNRQELFPVQCDVRYENIRIWRGFVTRGTRFPY